MFNNSLIALFYPGSVTLYDGWKDKAVLNATASHMSLTLTSLRTSESGEYTLQANNGKFSIALSVQGEVKVVSFALLSENRVV